MAPLPPSNTARAWLDYADAFNQHSIMFRIAPTATLVTIKSQIDAVMLQLSPVLTLLTVVGFRVAVIGSNVTNPSPWTGAATYGSGTLLDSNAPRELRFIGRSTDGRQNSVSVYGFSGATPGDYRIDASESADVSDTILALANASALGVGLTISGQVPVWKPYASFNFNSYWEKEARP